MDPRELNNAPMYYMRAPATYAMPPNGIPVYYAVGGDGGQPMILNVMPYGDGVMKMPVMTIPMQQPYQKAMYVAPQMMAPPQMMVQKKTQAQAKELYKTDMCKSWLTTGTCGYGDRCLFAHGEHELRSVPKPDKYKTTLCRHFAATGSCPYGSKCRFIHGVEDISATQTHNMMNTSLSPVNETLSSEQRDTTTTPQDNARQQSSLLANDTQPIVLQVATPLRGNRSVSAQNMNKPPVKDDDEDDDYMPASALVLLAKSRSHPVLDFGHHPAPPRERRSEPQSPRVPEGTGKTPGAERRALVMDLSEWKENIAAELAHLEI